MSRWTNWLGPQFTGWIEANIERLMSDPSLKPHRGRASAALPQAPQYITEVQAPAGTLMRVGEAGPIPGWGNGVDAQVQLMDRIPASAYQNARPRP
jgi:hypothetical protein